jgi:hypothetical protein
MDRAYRIRPDVVHRQWQGEHYFLTPDGRFHSVTDPSGAFVLSLLSRRGRTIPSMTRAILERFEATSETEVQHDLQDFLETLCRREVLEVVGKTPEEPASGGAPRPGRRKR